MATRVIVLLFAAWAVAGILLFVVDHGDRPAHADAVFVLSGSGTRLPVGVKLVREGFAPVLVLSRTLPKPLELERRACAQQLGIRVLCVQARPYSTVGEAEALGRLARAHNWRSVDVVTSAYHIVRARIIVRRCYHGKLRMVSAPNVTTWLPWNVVLESTKLVYHELVHRGC